MLLTFVKSLITSLIAVIGSTIASGQFLFQMGFSPQTVYLTLLFGCLLGGIAHILFYSGKEGTSRIKSKFMEVVGLVCITIFSGMFLVEFSIYYFKLRELIDKGEISEWFVYSGVIFFGGSVVAGGRVGLEYTLSLLGSLLQTAAEKWLSTRRNDNDD